jgi:glycosyltransferase involved in cell wall biosynthesis
MKVLHIITGLNDGGAEAVLYSLIKSKNSTFHHTVISFLDMGKYGPLLKEAGVNVYCLNLSLSRTVLNFFSIFKMFNLIKKIKPDVVQTWMIHANFVGGIIARLAGVKNIIWGIHNTGLIGKAHFLTIFFTKLNSHLSKFIPNKVIYCGQKCRDNCESMGYPVHKGVLVRNGFDVSQFIPNNQSGHAFRNELNISDLFLIGNVGRFHPQKDHKTLLLALNKLKKKSDGKFHCILVGTNLDNDNLELIRLRHELDLKENISFIGQRNDIPAVMNAIDLFILSSAFGEAFPCVLNEAMACGTPCVTTDVGDSTHIVSNTGWTVPVTNPAEALAESIILAMNEKQSDQSSWEDRKNRARARIVDNFTLEKMVKEYELVWLEGIKKFK